jgi:hypothetical protein
MRLMTLTLLGCALAASGCNRSTSSNKPAPQSSAQPATTAVDATLAKEPEKVFELCRGCDPDGKQPQKWYAPNSSFSDCIASDGPAGRIDTFGNDDKPVVTEHKDKYNVMYKVEVTKYNRGGTTTSWTYFKTAEACVAEEVESNKTVADKYR